MIQLYYDSLLDSIAYIEPGSDIIFVFDITGLAFPSARPASKLAEDERFEFLGFL
jgi:hypothetical protein